VMLRWVKVLAAPQQHQQQPGPETCFCCVAV
jgi:hypothetical protein